MTGITYLSGCLSDQLPPKIGVMLTPDMGQAPLPDRPWAADTGCFANPTDYSDQRYLAFLEDHAGARDRCLFATAPDVWNDAAATAELARPLLREIRALGFPAAIVAQPGTAEPDVPWDEVDALFLGGPDTWQFSRGAWELARLARRLGKHVHRGRVNSYRRFREAELQGCHSCDGTALRFDPTGRAVEIGGWLHRVALQPPLLLELGAD